MYDMVNGTTVVMAGLVIGVACMMMLICYIIESVFLAKIASKRGENVLLAWIPIANFFLLRKMARKKLRWQWLVAFFAAALLGSSVVRWLGLQVLVWSMTIWYWTAFHTIMEEETELSVAWLICSLFCFPVKLYVMYKMAE